MEFKSIFLYLELLVFASVRNTKADLSGYQCYSCIQRTKASPPGTPGASSGQKFDIDRCVAMGTKIKYGFYCLRFYVPYDPLDGFDGQSRKYA